MAHVAQEYSKWLMSLVQHGEGKDHASCMDIIARLTRERDQAAAQRDNLRAALIAAVGLERVCEVETWGFKADVKRRERMKIEAA